MRPIADPRVRAAFEAVDRRWFLRPGYRRAAGSDRPLPIGHEQTNSQPTTVAAMLELLDVQPGQRVLDVGTGSGWSTALLAHLVGPTGRVVGVELVPDLAVWGAANLAGFDVPWATIEEPARGVLGAPERGPYDRILVSAEARVLPPALVAQLGDKGVLVIPVCSRMLRVGARPGAAPEITEHGRYSFVPLRRVQAVRRAR